ncbi:hypothetical protein BB558_003421 [Smittium angustum]|uniref:DUF1772 domain-containing protein n=1 Tax=Smittium angustum TaxID=133377 RepID=A0A2U1J626_SMIAN|nr:hypothetical protein BB558_003421 [Smittium angustum]
MIFPVSALALFENGIFTGLSYTMNLVSVPIMKASSDPLSAFCTNLEKASTIGVLTSVIGGLSHFYVYYKTGSIGSMICGIGSIIIIPYTLMFIMPTNNILTQMHREKSTDKQRVFKLVSKWNRLQWVRTIIGTGTFVLAINEYTKA